LRLGVSIVVGGSRSHQKCAGRTCDKPLCRSVYCGVICARSSHVHVSCDLGYRGGFGTRREAQISLITDFGVGACRQKSGPLRALSKMREACSRSTNTREFAFDPVWVHIS